MEIVITLIGTVIGAVIGWNWSHLTGKGKFTRLDINDDGSVWLEFDYKKRFGKIGDNYKSELTEILKRDFKGLTEVNATKNRPNGIMVCMKLEKEKDEPFVLWLEDQEKELTRLCGNFKRKEKEEVISSELIAENKDYRIYKCNNRDTKEHIGYLLLNIQDGYPDLFRGTLQDFGEYITRKYNFIKSLEVSGNTIKFNT